MADDLLPVFELQTKISGLKEWATRTNRSGLKSEHDIAKRIGLNRNTFKSHLRAGQIPSDKEQALADVFGFRIAWPEWRDLLAGRNARPDQRRDTPAAFMERFLKTKNESSPLTIESGLVQKYLDRRFADFFLAVPGSFAPQSQDEGIPLVLSLSFDRRGWPVLLDGLKEVITVGLKQVEVQLFHTRSTAKITTSDILCRSQAEGNFQGSAEGISAWWVISVVRGEEPWLMGKRLPNDGLDCVCSGLQIGDKIRALMTARVDGCFVRVPGELFEDTSDAKIKFMEHLHKLAVLNGPEAVLGEQVLTVVDKS
jgi:hypothetical protein